MIDLCFHRLNLAISAYKSEKWTPQARAKLQEHRLLAYTNSVVLRSLIQGLVKQLNSNIYIVDLEKGTCSCLVYQENGILYRHAITTIFAVLSRDLIPYMLEILSIEIQKKTYTSNFPLLDIIDLQKVNTNSECHPPLTRVPRSRPKKEQYKKGKTRALQGEAAAYALAEPANNRDNKIQLPYYYFICGERGHYSTTCKRPYEQRQQAYKGATVKLIRGR